MKKIYITDRTIPAIIERDESETEAYKHHGIYDSFSQAKAGFIKDIQREISFIRVDLNYIKTLKSKDCIR